MAMKERTGRNRVSKADDVSRKVNNSASNPTTSTRVRPSSKVDDISRKINGPSSKPTSSSRVRPSSKVDDISRKINSPSSGPTDATPTRVRPSSKVDEISRKIPSRPAAVPERPSDPIPPQASSRVTPPQPVSQPVSKRSGGCCLLPFALGVLGIVGALIMIF